MNVIKINSRQMFLVSFDLACPVTPLERDCDAAPATNAVVCGMRRLREPAAFWWCLSFLVIALILQTQWGGLETGFTEWVSKN